jgi:hypothetical protein
MRHLDFASSSTTDCLLALGCLLLAIDCKFERLLQLHIVQSHGPMDKSQCAYMAVVGNV